MRITRTFSLFVATVIILLHSVIAHSHHSDLSESENLEIHQEASDFTDFIALGFHGDHQEGQMEEFTASSVNGIVQKDFIQLVAILYTVFTVTNKEQKCELYSNLELTAQSNFYTKSIDLRGPPSKS